MNYTSIQPRKTASFTTLLLILLLSACQSGGQQAPVDEESAGPDEATTVTDDSTASHTVSPVSPRVAEPSPQPQPTDGKNILPAGQSLQAGDLGLTLSGEEIAFGARITDDGQFILYNSGDRIWSPVVPENALPAQELIMQEDGNLVLYDRHDRSIWSSETHPYFGSDKYNTPDWKPVKLVLEPNLLVLYSATGRKVWTSEKGEIGHPDRQKDTAKNLYDLPPKENITLQSFTMADWPAPLRDDDSGCSCNFRATIELNDEGDVLGATYANEAGNEACMKWNGKMILLREGEVKNPDYKRGDFHRYYFNDQYDVQIIAFEEGTDDGGNAQVAGTLTLMDKDGRILQAISVWGGCGC